MVAVVSVVVELMGVLCQLGISHFFGLLVFVGVARRSK